MMASEHAFIGVSDGVPKTPKLKHVDQRPYCVLGQEKHTIAIQRKKVAEWTTADKVALPFLPSRVSLIPLKSASGIYILNKSSKVNPWVLHDLLFFNDEYQLVFLLN